MAAEPRIRTRRHNASRVPSRVSLCLHRASTSPCSVRLRILTLKMPKLMSLQHTPPSPEHILGLLTGCIPKHTTAAFRIQIVIILQSQQLLKRQYQGNSKLIRGNARQPLTFDAKRCESPFIT